MPLRPLCPELQEKARVELNEDPKRIESDLQILKDWISKQPHLKARTDDQWLVVFLRGCKYSLERAKEKLDLYYSLRTLLPELYQNRNPNIFDELMDFRTYLVLPNSDHPDRPRTVLVRFGALNSEQYSFEDFVRTALIIERISFMEDDVAVISGVQMIIDLKGVTMGHLKLLTPSVMKKSSVQSQDASPVRMKGAHYLNITTAFEKVLNTMKIFLNEKNKKRLYIYNDNYEEMYKFIPKETLPVEYGGNAGTMQEIADYWKAKRQEYSSWLEEDLQYGTDESKRPGKPKTSESLFGIDGSSDGNIYLDQVTLNDEETVLLDIAVILRKSLGSYLLITVDHKAPK